jgi:hypothetical protein
MTEDPSISRLKQREEFAPATTTTSPQLNPPLLRLNKGKPLHPLEFLHLVTRGKEVIRKGHAARSWFATSIDMTRRLPTTVFQCDEGVWYTLVHFFHTCINVILLYNII